MRTKNPSVWLELASRFPFYPDQVRRHALDALQHEFELLGSGRVVVAHGIHCRGLLGHAYEPTVQAAPDQDGKWLSGRINRANLKNAQWIWKLVDKGYVPIDWQLDFKSGYRWREDMWHGDISFGRPLGADVKIPWELARLQHLPTLAMACHFAQSGHHGFQAQPDYARELRNQTLDFIANNPPGFGVNWVCAMDVAIRAANIVIAHEIAAAAGVSFDREYETILASAMWAHGRHITANLEWDTRYRGNHYLANIAGLAFVGSFLSSDPEVDAWLAFAAQELLDEIAYQFHPDGSNFEASICYHRLSAEIVLWTCARLAGLPTEKRAVFQRPQVHRSLPRLLAKSLPMHRLPWGTEVSPVPPWCWERLMRMGEFTRAVTRPDGLVVQFGDNDSGRFVTVGSDEQSPEGREQYDAKSPLDHRALVNGIQTLLGLATAGDPAAHLLKLLAGMTVDEENSVVFQSHEDHHAELVLDHADELVWAGACDRRDVSESSWLSRFAVRNPHSSGSLLSGLQCLAFPGMGVYVLRGPRLFLAIRCGEVGLAGLGAHAHCDQLGIELVIDGETLVRDPGTYLYTANLAKRNAYRSVKAHHVPRVAGREPADLSRHPFDLSDLSPGECLYFGPHGFFGRHAGYGPYVYRLITLADDAVIVEDFAEGGLVLADPAPDPLPFSPGYGQLLDPSVRCDC